MDPARWRVSLVPGATEVENFAATFLDSRQAGPRISNRELAESLRKTYDLGPFPKLPELTALCESLEIAVSRRRLSRSMEACNVWTQPGRPEVYLDEDLRGVRVETTLAHELREVIENAFARVCPEYLARPTNHPDMNAESDRFASYLLMEEQRTHGVLERAGFSAIICADQVSRSLSSVIYRMQQMYSAGSDLSCPVWTMGLFELEERGMTLNHQVSLGGFSVAKGSLRGLNEVVPRRRTVAETRPFLSHAIRSASPVSREVPLFQLWDQQCAVEIAEPIIRNGLVTSLLHTFVDGSKAGEVAPWLQQIERLKTARSA